jgi:hypothetical protein
MSLTRVSGERTLLALTLLAATASMLLATGALDAVFAQGAPFTAPRGMATPPPADGIVGWMFAKQAEFYRDMSRIIRAAKTDGSAVWTLLGVSFLCGIFHAAGPGHGKAVISSYLVANEETWRRGIVLSLPRRCCRPSLRSRSSASRRCCSTPPRADVQRGAGHRACELRADRARWRAASGSGQGLSPRGARPDRPMHAVLRG